MIPVVVLGGTLFVGGLISVINGGRKEQKKEEKEVEVVWEHLKENGVAFAENETQFKKVYKKALKSGFELDTTKLTGNSTLCRVKEGSMEESLELLKENGKVYIDNSDVKTFMNKAISAGIEIIAEKSVCNLCVCSIKG